MPLAYAVRVGILVVCLHTGLSADLGQIRPYISVGGICDHTEVHILQGHVPGTYFEYLQSGVPSGGSDQDPLVDPSRPEDGRIYHVRSVGGGYHRHIVHLLHTVHGREYLVHDVLPSLAS